MVESKPLGFPTGASCASSSDRHIVLDIVQRRNGQAISPMSRRALVLHVASQRLKVSHLTSSNTRTCVSLDSQQGVGAAPRQCVQLSAVCVNGGRLGDVVLEDEANVLALDYGLSNSRRTSRARRRPMLLRADVVNQRMRSQPAYHRRSAAIMRVRNVEGSAACNPCTAICIASHQGRSMLVARRAR